MGGCYKLIKNNYQSNGSYLNHNSLSFSVPYSNIFPGHVAEEEGKEKILLDIMMACHLMMKKINRKLLNIPRKEVEIYICITSWEI